VAGFALALAVLMLAAWQRARAAGSTLSGDVARAALLFVLVFTADSFTTPQLFTGFACMTLAVLLTMSPPDPAPAPLGRHRATTARSGSRAAVTAGARGGR